MALFEELIVRGNPPEMLALRDRLGNAQAPEWRRDLEAEARLRSMKAAPDGAMSFACGEAHDRPRASLLLAPRGPSELYLANIIPLDRNRVLTPDEYRVILDHFVEELLVPACDGAAVQWTRAPISSRPEVVLSREAHRRFYEFNASAISRSALNPLDVKRWNDFVIQVHRDDDLIEPNLLNHWLMDASWSDEIRHRLVSDYLSAMSLLAEYDEELSAR